MKKIACLLISIVIGFAVFFSSTLDAHSGGVLGDINADGKVDLKEVIYSLQVVAGIRSSDNPNNFVGIWKGNGTFVAPDETNTGLLTLSLFIQESSIIGSFVYDTDTLVNITGTVTNGIFSFVVPNSDPSNADCANWSVIATATLDESLTTMSLIFNGTFCGSGGGKPGIFSAILTKQSPSTVSGTVTYNGSLGTVSADSPIIVILTPFPEEFNATDNGSSTQITTLIKSPDTFTFINVPAGQYHVVAIFDFNSDGVTMGDPGEIYTPGDETGSNYHADPATAFTVTVGQVTSTNIIFADGFRVGD